MKVLIPAAGKGSRSGLSYPKTLKVFNDIPLLMRTMLTVSELDARPVIIVSPEGKRPIEKTISEWAFKAEILVQEEPRGLGDAILCFRESEYFDNTENVLAIWGDMISVQIETLRKLMRLFKENNSVFAFPTRISSPCYTHVTRSNKGRVISLIERLEFGDAVPVIGESDVGIFMFNKEIVFNAMKNQGGLLGKSTNEIGFLQVVSLLSEQYWIDAFLIADEIDALSFNTDDDLIKAKEVLC